MRGFSFCIQETDSTAALGPDTSALSRLRGPRKKAQHFFGERRSGGECAAEAPRPPREQSLLRRRDQEVVADAIAPSANDCYSVPYKSRHLNQKEKLRFYAGFFFLHSGNGFDCGSWSRHKRAIAVTGSPKKGAAFFWGEEERRRMCGGSAAPAAGSISMFNLGRRWSRMVPDKRTCNNFGIKGLTGL